MPSTDEREYRITEGATFADNKSERAETKVPAGDSGGISGATSMPESISDSETYPDERPGDEGTDPAGNPSSSGCSAPASGDAPTAAGIALLLTTPLGLMAFPGLRRRWPFR